MARIEYKFWYIKENDAGFVEEVAVRFYEGDYAPYTFTYPDGTVVNGTRFVRTKRLGAGDLSFLNKGILSTELNGSPVVVFKIADFGVNLTRSQLESLLKLQVARDRTRTPINEQL
jgi:hypothetical protein